ncbi:MAG: acetyl-CoA carboxylase carboxyltransferase subunit [Polyangiaceae bacterium UTPRO1]|jgi:acetyl-CoA carboxylase carboxyltransferase component|nr:acyl-CoA carboxylase subunit beta [Myxococcales bacterium]OQY66198.1 MAG: acetyl-CoA carboxylase carboxyltransferase subunit [Polyangiaceae bacterium UTPRO1]
MEVLRTNVDTRSETYRQNRDGFLEQIKFLNEQLALVREGGGAKYVKRHVERGKLMARERIELLLDRDSPFLEIAPLCAWGTEFALGGSVISGIGVVSGVECVITANEPTIKGGSINPFGALKTGRTMEICAQNRMPIINLTESGGADLPFQSTIFVPGGRGFRELTRRSRERIPTICLVFGSSTAGGAYVPGMSDYVVMVKNGAKVFLGGPPLVKMAIHEDVDEETLGGADMHSRVSGVSDYLAQDERDAIRLGREIVAQLNWRKLGWSKRIAVEEPLYDPDEMLGIASIDVRKPFDVKEILARIVDGSRFHEFKPTYGTTLVTGYAHIHGYPVGILANNGILFSESSEKGAQFIQLCNSTNTPIIFFQNITGFMVGSRYEQGGIIKDGAKLINAVSNSTVPHLTMMIGASYGAGNYGMAGRAYDPRFIFSWPNHRIAVMGPEQLAGVLSIVRRQAAERAGQPFDEQEDAMIRQMVQGQIEKESYAFFATARVWDDGIIDPRDTRTVLGITLSAVHNGVIEGTSGYGVFRM